MTNAYVSKAGLHVVSMSAGIALGWAAFRLPQWACGPFQSMVAAAWWAVGVAAMAALLTLGAIIVAMLSAAEANRTARDISQSQIDTDTAKVEAMRHRFSVIFRAELFILADTLRYAADHLRDRVDAQDWSEVRRTLREDIPTNGLTLLLKFSGDLYAFPPTVGGYLAYALWRWTEMTQGPEPKCDSTQQTHDSAAAFVCAADVAVADFRTAYNSLEQFIPDGTTIGPKERAFAKRVGIWANR
jgi:hypothetical protein